MNGAVWSSNLVLGGRGACSLGDEFQQIPVG